MQIAVLVGVVRVDLVHGVSDGRGRPSPGRAAPTLRQSRATARPAMLADYTSEHGPLLKGPDRLAGPTQLGAS
jgi:hypothetical protein